MEEEVKESKSLSTVCPVCSSPREDESAEKCASCGADLSAMRSLENFAQSLLLDAKNDIRERKYNDATVKLDIASGLDSRNAIAAKLVGVDIDINNNVFDRALKTYEEVKKSGFDATKWGIDLDKKIAELKDRLAVERAAKEHYNLALHRSKEGFFAEAREELYKAADLAPYLAEIYLLAAKVDLALGAESAVYDDITRYRQLRPDDCRGVNMQTRLDQRKSGSVIFRTQIFFASLFFIFAVVVLVVVTLFK